MERDSKGGKAPDVDEKHRMQLRSSKKSSMEFERSLDGKWIRGKKIGQGSFKSVFSAICRDGGGEFAWNMVKLDKMRPEQEKEVRREVSILQGAKHPRIIEFFDSWEEKPYFHFITEYVPSSLRSRVATLHPVRLPTIRSWCRQILKALVHLHTRSPPIIHRDLKCDNVLIASDGTVRLGDFGLAITGNSKTSDISGTPNFMAPEVWSESYDCKADIYAFGMLLLEVKMNDVPYRERKTLIVDMLRGEKLSPPAALDAKNFEEEPRRMNKLLRQMITSCIEWDPKDRPSAKELLDHEFFRPKLFQILDCEVRFKDKNPFDVRLNLKSNLDYKLDFEADLSSEGLREIAVEFEMIFADKIHEKFPDSHEQNLTDIFYNFTKEKVWKAQQALENPTLARDFKWASKLDAAAFANLNEADVAAWLKAVKEHFSIKEVTVDALIKEEYDGMGLLRATSEELTKVLEKAGRAARVRQALESVKKKSRPTPKYRHSDGSAEERVRPSPHRWLAFKELGKELQDSAPRTFFSTIGRSHANTVA